MKNNLKIGIVENGEDLRILIEMLNHQGLIYEQCTYEEIEKFPCAIEINSENGIDNFSEKIDSSLLIIDKNRLFLFQKAIEGRLKLTEDEMVNATVTQLELDLIEKVKNYYQRKNLPFVRKWYWPEFKDACCIMTHDIDEIDRCPSRKKWKMGCLKYLLNHLLNRNFGDNINTILDIEDRELIKSTFFFLSGYPGKDTSSKILEDIIQKEHEIGLHGSIMAALSASSMEQEHKELQGKMVNKIFGYRQHTLNKAFRIPKTLELINNEKFLYDLSISFNKRFGFRSGLCYPYHPFHSGDGTKLELLELPSPYMDWTGLYRNFDATQHLKIIEQIIRTVEIYHGCMAFSFHNSYLNENTHNEILEAFKKTLSYISRKKFWNTTAKESAEWWLNREKTMVEVYYKNKYILGETTNPTPLIIEYPKKTLKVNVHDSFKI